MMESQTLLLVTVLLSMSIFHTRIVVTTEDDVTFAETTAGSATDRPTTTSVHMISTRIPTADTTTEDKIVPSTLTQTYPISKKLPTSSDVATSIANGLATTWFNPLTKCTTLKNVFPTTPTHQVTTEEDVTTDGLATQSTDQSTEVTSTEESNTAMTRKELTTDDELIKTSGITTQRLPITSEITDSLTATSNATSPMTNLTSNLTSTTQNATDEPSTSTLVTSATTEMLYTGVTTVNFTTQTNPNDPTTTPEITTSKTTSITTSPMTNLSSTTQNVTDEHSTSTMVTSVTTEAVSTERTTINLTTLKNPITNDTTTRTTLNTTAITPPITNLTANSTSTTQNATDEPSTSTTIRSATTEVVSTTSTPIDRQTASVTPTANEYSTLVSTDTSASMTTSRIPGDISTLSDLTTGVGTTMWTMVVTSLLPLPVDINCPNDITQPTDPGSPFAVVTWPDVIANDTTGYLNVTSNYTSGDQFPIGTTTVTYVAVDDGVARASCSFNITIRDLEPPYLDCSSDVTTFADGEDRVSVTWRPPTVWDNSGLYVWVNSTHNPEDEFLIGNTIVCYWATDVYDNQASCSFLVIVIARCPEDQTEDGELGILTWPATIVNITAESDQRCHIDTDKRGYGLATRFCRFDEETMTGTWESSVVQECGETDEVELGDLPDTPVVEDNVEEVADALEELTEDNSNLTPDDISDIAETLENIVEVASPSVEVTTSVVETIDNILRTEDSSLSNSANTTSSIVISLETQVAVTLQAEGVIKVVESTLAVDGLTVITDDVVDGLTFAVLDDGNINLNDDEVITFNNVNDVPKQVETKIQLPKSILSSLISRDNNTSQVSFSIYQDDSLFNSQQTKSENFTIAGAVVSAEVFSPLPEYFNESVVIHFLPIQMRGIDYALLNTSVCVFWDFHLNQGSGDWSSEGCVFMGITDGRVVCECYHLTNFAVIIDISGYELSDKQAFALTVITYIGCALSMLGLVITLSIFIGFRKLRIGRVKCQRMILIHFCFSLLFLYLVFVVGIDLAVGSTIGCVVVAGLIQYFTLTSMSWMAIEARHLYLKLVQIFDAEKDWFLTAATIIGWGCPLIVVSVSIAVGLLHVGEYVSDEYCFIPLGPVLYYGLVLPIGLLLLHNFVTFALIMHSLVKPRTGGTASVKTDKSQKKEIREHLFRALMISVLLGLTWVLGFLAIEGATFAFQLLFCLFNSFQGVMIFILFCLRSKDVRNMISPYFHWIKIPDQLNRKARNYAVKKVEDQQTSHNLITTSEVPVSLSTFNFSLQYSESEHQTNDLDRVTADIDSQPSLPTEETETQFGHVNEQKMNVHKQD